MLKTSIRIHMPVTFILHTIFIKAVSTIYSCARISTRVNYSWLHVQICFDCFCFGWLYCFTQVVSRIVRLSSHFVDKSHYSHSLSWQMCKLGLYRGHVFHWVIIYWLSYRILQAIAFYRALSILHLYDWKVPDSISLDAYDFIRQCPDKVI